MIYDIAILGVGPTGLYAAKEFARKGKNVVVFEKDKLGGVSTHEGCIPAKSLLYTATMWDVVNDIDKFGFHYESEPTFDYKKIFARKRKISERIQNKIAARIENKPNIELVYGYASLDGESDGTINILVSKESYRAKIVLLATGSVNFVPPIIGLDKIDVLDAKKVMDLEEVPKSLTIIGGGVLGVEFASLFATFGSQVNVVERSDEILSSNDKELSELLRKELEKKGITFYLNANVEKVNEIAVFVEEDNKTLELKSEKILLATGRIPLTIGLNLDSLNIKLTPRGAVAVNQLMQTSHPQVYAFGDIVGGAMLVHAGVLEADVAISHIMNEEMKLDYNIVPGVVYTTPEMSFVGAMERNLKEKKIEYEIVRAPLTDSDRYIQENDIDAPGMIKMLVGKKDRKILGVHVLGYPASEFITIASIAISEGYTTEKFRKIIFPYPTVSRILRDIL